MKIIELWNVKTVRQVMAMFGLGFRKEFGQNFLTDPNVLWNIADVCAKSEKTTVLEIGPGIGTLTRELAQRYENIVALEIDKSLIPVLKYTLGDFDNVRVINEDVMQTDLESLLSESFAKGPVAVCANLPYYITTPILMKLLESRLPFESITVMVQAEVAERLAAEAGNKAYGAITAVLGYYGKAELLERVPAERFLPAPKVDSAVVKITLWKEKPCVPKSEDLFFRTIKAAFGQRRKTLANALSAGFPELSKERIQTVLADMDLDPNIRGERLSTKDFCRLSDLLKDAVIS